MFLGAERHLALQLLAFVSNIACLLLSSHHVELITCLWCAIKTKNQTWFARKGLLDTLSTLVEHGFDLTMIDTCEDNITMMERTILHEHSSHIATTFVERRLDDRALGTAVWIGFEFEHLGFEKHFLKEFEHAFTLLSRDMLALVRTTPILYEDIHVGELLLDLIWVSTWFIALVDSENHWHTSCLRVVDSLDSLWHDRIVGSHNDNRNIRHLRTAGTHGSKRLVTRSIEESDVLTILQLHVIRTNVLGDTTCLTSNHVGITDMVEERCLTVVYVTHDGYDWAAFGDILFVDNLIGIDFLNHFGRNELSREAKLLGNEVDGFCIKALVDTNHDAEHHTCTDDLGHRHVHHHGEVVGGHKLSEFEHLALLLLRSALLRHLLAL